MADVPPPPPPPENPFGMNNGEPDPFAMPENEGLDQGTPNVAAKPGRVLLVLGIVGLVIAFLLYSIFFSSSTPVKPVPKPGQPAGAIIEPPRPPSNPIPIPVPTPTPPPPPPPPKPDPLPTSGNITGIFAADDGAAKAQADARRRSKIMLQDSGGGGGLGLGLGGGSNAPAPTNDANSQYADSVIRANTTAQRVAATRIGDLRRTIAQGRIIQATMESALNTDLPAPIRAIVSRDTYGESGTVPLIPKGSRLIGSYNTTLTGGQSRVFVVWTRVIRPDGVDIMLGSPLVDPIGQAGVGGQVDSKFQQVFSRSILASIVSIGFAIGSDKISGGSTTTTSSSAGTSTTGDAATTATVNALNRLGTVTDSFIQKFVNVQPTILVDQGTAVNVFVNRDLVFPSDMAGTRVIN